MKLNINENTAEKALFGDDTKKIKTFAVISGKKFNLSESDQLSSFKDDLKELRIKYTEITSKNDSIEYFLIYNVTLKDTEYIAGKYEQELFFYGFNSVPSQTACYETENSKSYIITKNKKDITTIDDIEEFISKYGDFPFKTDVKLLESMKNVNESVTDESERDLSLDESRTLRSIALHRGYSYKKY